MIECFNTKVQHKLWRSISWACPAYIPVPALITVSFDGWWLAPVPVEHEAQKASSFKSMCTALSPWKCYILNFIHNWSFVLGVGRCTRKSFCQNAGKQSWHHANLLLSELLTANHARLVGLFFSSASLSFSLPLCVFLPLFPVFLSPLSLTSLSLSPLSLSAILLCRSAKDVQKLLPLCPVALFPLSPVSLAFCLSFHLMSISICLWCDTEFANRHCVNMKKTMPITHKWGHFLKFPCSFIPGQ